MIKYDNLQDKLKKAMKKAGLSVSKLAEKAGIHQVSLSRILNGHRKLNNLDTLYKLSKALGVSLDYFFTNSDIAENPETFAEDMGIDIFYGDKKELNDKYPDHIKIPLVRSKAAATPAIIEISSDEVDGWVCISAENVPKNISERCFAFRVKGDSMEPMLRENDLVAVLPYSEPPALDTIIPSNVYLVKISDGFGGYGLTLKHIHQIDDRTVELVSDNKKYPNKEIDISEPDNFQIMGRVIWMWREM
ncbi:XRE family transcriptional regulator [Flexistipes sp.]|uniref:XRE family transcriptional regulator n=1 Tax=Flexistipes sp. TaxID=3088135 RepID=UPI002E1EA73B|nr:LexA family transcriptional regulator [Flexistipes sp.]